VKEKSLIVWFLVGLIAVLIAVFPFPVTAASPASRTIQISASSYAYDPATIEVNLGDQVTIELSSADVVHGIHIDGYDFEMASEPGQTTRATFVANQSGVFSIRCSVTCGDLHPFMMGKLYVGRNELLWRAAGLSLLAAIAGLMLYKRPAPEAQS